MTNSNDKRSNKWSWIFHIGLLILIIWISVSFRDTLRFSDLTPLISILQNTSAMIFTIMGIWIAYLYPEAIVKIINSSKDEVSIPNNDTVKPFPLKKEFDKKSYIKNESRIKIIVGIVALSASVMICLIIITLAYPLVINSWIYQTTPSVIRGLGLFVIVTLTYAQIFAIYIVIASNINFLRDITKLKNEMQLHKKLYPELYRDE